MGSGIWAHCVPGNAAVLLQPQPRSAGNTGPSTQVRRWVGSVLSSWHDQRKYSPRANPGSRLKFHDPPRFPRGFRCASRNVGLKTEARDLALFASDVDASAAAVFTRNQFPGAPVILGRETIRSGVLRLHSGNVGDSPTAEQGMGIAAP